MFVFRAADFLRALKTHRAQTLAHSTKLAQADSPQAGEAVYRAFVNESIDYGLMVKNTQRGDYSSGDGVE